MQELKAQKIWVCWRYTMVKGNRTKKPFSAYGTATGTDAPHRHSWVTYDEALTASKEKHFDGIGFIIPKGYVFLDIDHRGLDNPLVQTMLRRFDTYAEHSVSGGGIHFYGKCDREKIPFYIDGKGQRKLDKTYYTKHPKTKIELYVGGMTNRFAVFTGNVIIDKPLKDCTAAVLTTLDKDMRRSKKQKYSAKRDGERNIYHTISKLREQKNGEKFAALFDRGDITGYGSPSEADAALCALIAFRTGADAEMIDAIFRQSALYREKWEREDYREATIAVGIDACQGVFHRSKMEHPYFIRFHEKTGAPYVEPSMLAKYVREHLDYILVRNSGKQGLLKYVYERGAYRIYADDMMKGVIKKFISDYDEELVRIKPINEAFQLLATDLDYVPQEKLDADERLINFQNGLLYVSAAEAVLHPHSPKAMSTIQIPCNWTGKETPTPVFDRYMNTLTGGDAATRQLLLEFMGACISNVKGWRMKKALFLVGEGDTGKSQLKSLVERLLGAGNYIGIDLTEIEARFGTGALYGTRLAGSSDMSFLTVAELKTFKKITGGDSLFAEFKGQQGFEFTYGGLLWFCMNRLPKFGGDDGKWVYNRIMAVKCPNAIPKDAQDKLLLDKMYAEREGIVHKAVLALQTVIANGYRFSEPESIHVIRETYRRENNTVICFFEECMEEREESKYTDGATTGRIYNVYKAWCQDNNHGFSKTAKEFRDELAAHVGSTFKDISLHTRTGTYYRTFTLTQEVMMHYRKTFDFYAASDFSEDFLA